VKKDIKYYLSLNYPIEIVKIPEDEGGGYSACIPILGRNAFISDGETIEEVLKNLEIIKEENFKRMLEKGIPIPEPEEQKDEDYSGKFLVRIPKELHRELVRRANKNGTSLNQYLQYVIAKGLMSSSFDEMINSWLNKFDQTISEIKPIVYQFENKEFYEETSHFHLNYIIHKHKEEQYSKVG